ncbi:PREDICTED: uncharacterized protein C9orf40 homolog [Gekko japonicus]|uniref:Uncharacterized protein C9orf40 homolog n=1 Tax=Gekko japonicus TaxID=146911 RepID=A0ABM1K007_GEKJA|nr:PREDICTED: uncharacterized protein C9orf40 homolog [Gekko japonicus]
MAKRGAEAVAFHAPWETLAPPRPPKRGRSEPGLRELRCGKTPWSGGGCKKRKRAEEDEETSAKWPSGALKRSRPQEEQVPGASASGWEGTRTRRKEPPGPLPEADEEAGSGETPAHPWNPKTSMAEEHQDDVWHYNSFQYWRPPLPAIDLSDILDLEKENMVKTRNSSGAGLSEMET